MQKKKRTEMEGKKKGREEKRGREGGREERVVSTNDGSCKEYKV